MCRSLGPRTDACMAFSLQQAAWIFEFSVLRLLIPIPHKSQTIGHIWTCLLWSCKPGTIVCCCFWDTTIYWAECILGVSVKDERLFWDFPGTQTNNFRIGSLAWDLSYSPLAARFSMSIRSLLPFRVLSLFRFIGVDCVHFFEKVLSWLSICFLLKAATRVA